MKNCIFCQIGSDQSGEDYRIIYADKNYIAMLVSHPETVGHFIVFPRAHYSEMSEMTDPGAFFEKVLKLAEEKIKKIEAKAFTLKLNNNLYKLESDNPLHVGHIHMHVVPRFSKGDNASLPPDQATRESLEEIKNRLAS
jgi:diadenosine tetraphosphate (Ap4A) HIT family hydrolase